MKRLGIRFGALCVLVYFCTPARAAVVYTYRFDQPNYPVVVGQTVDVNVYLRETRQFTFETSLLSEGLFSAGVFLQFTDASSSRAARVLGAGDIRTNPAFDDPFSPVTRIDPTQGAGMLANVGLLDTQGVQPTVINPLIEEVFLGRFRFTALQEGVARIEATHFSSGDDTLTFRTGTVLDSRILAADAAVTVAPEPSGLVLLVAGVCGLMAARLRRAVRLRVPSTP